MKKNQKSKKASSRSHQKNNNRKDQELRLYKSYPGQPAMQCWIPVDSFKLTTTVTTGVIANAAAISSALITNFTTRFATWDEYRIVGLRVAYDCMSSTNPGVIVAWTDEKVNTVGLAQSRANRANRFNASDVTKRHTLKYVPHDVIDLNYNAIGTAQTIGHLLTYTDNAVYGSSIVATDYLVVTAELEVQFRGFA